MTGHPLYGSLAVLVVLAHFAFVLFVMFGGLLWIRWRWAPVVHLPAAAWGAWIELSRGVCPLTPLEHRLRRMAGGEAYPGGFLEHYILRVLYPPGLTPTVQWALGLGAIALNVVIYLWVLRRRRRSSSHGTTEATDGS